MKKLNPQVAVALKDALHCIYWKKRDLRQFLKQCGVSDRILTVPDWENQVKAVSAEQVLDELEKSGDTGLGVLRRIIQVVCQMKRFDHLLREDDGQAKVASAKRAVAQLVALVGEHDRSAGDDREAATRRERAAEEQATGLHFGRKRGDLLRRFNVLVLSDAKQPRGFELERLLYELFALFDLDPKKSFKTEGDQIDGAFTLDNQDFLLEAKWQGSPIDLADLRNFAGKITARLDNTLGLFIAVNGFSKAALDASHGDRPRIIGADGGDLSAVLEGRIDLRDLLRAKRRHAAHTGCIFLSAADVITGERG